MNRELSRTLLASFATLKSLADEKKYRSSYQILSEFIRHIITEESLFSFDSSTMKNLLDKYYGFSIPEAVIRTAAKKMAGIELHDRIFIVSHAELGTDSLFNEKKKAVDEMNDSIMSALIEYVVSRTKKKVNITVLTQELIGFLVEDQQAASNTYTELIGEFVLKNEANKEIQAGLNRIREGSILYLGLNYNLDEIGSITKPLTLYLGTEILFSLAGFNGEIHKQLADDFYGLVRKANSGDQKKINLRYFPDVKKEIDDFFYSAENIVEGRRNSIMDTPAMMAITNGCKNAADVAMRQSDFNYNIQYGFGILEDTNNDYYEEANFKYNLESAPPDDDEWTKKKELGLKLVSHINKRRGGKRIPNEIDSEHLLVTNTRAILSVSAEKVEEIKREENLDYLSSFAVSLDKITSLLWYKLGNGFGNTSFPKNVDAVLQARIVLSSYIAKKADAAYSDIKRQYDNGTITGDRLAARIITLRHKPMRPEDLQGDDIETVMDFSPEFIRRFEEQVSTDRQASAEKDKIIEELKAEATKTAAEKDAAIEEQAVIIKLNAEVLTEKETQIAAQEKTISAKNKENALLQEKLDEYQRREGEEKQKKELAKRKQQFALSILWKAAVVIVVIALCIILCNKTESKVVAILGVLGSIVSVATALFSIIKKDYQKFFSEK